VVRITAILVLVESKTAEVEKRFAAGRRKCDELCARANQKDSPQGIQGEE
jgi:hypothetical protein